MRTWLQDNWRPIGSLVLIVALAVAMFTDRVSRTKFEIIAGVVTTAVLARSVDKAVQTKTQAKDPGE